MADMKSVKQTFPTRQSYHILPKEETLLPSKQQPISREKETAQAFSKQTWDSQCHRAVDVPGVPSFMDSMWGTQETMINHMGFFEFWAQQNFGISCKCFTIVLPVTTFFCWTKIRMVWTLRRRTVAHISQNSPWNLPPRVGNFPVTKSWSTMISSRKTREVSLNVQSCSIIFPIA